MYSFRIIPVLIVSLLFFTACDKDNRSQAEKDQEAIISFLEDNNLTTDAQSTDSGLYYVIEKPGSGSHPPEGATVIVHYRGTLLNGNVFDSSYSNGTPITISLNSVIKGWKEGIPLFKRGGKGLLIIPSALAYGNSGNGSIPANSVLLFEIELIDFI